MIHTTKHTDERREAGPIDCWCLHGAVGVQADFRDFSKRLVSAGISTRAVDLWRFLECGPLPIDRFGMALNADAAGLASRGSSRVLLGYSLGGRLALHALLEKNHPWQAAVVVSAHPGLESAVERETRRAADMAWAAQALTGKWQDFLTCWNEQPVLAGVLPRDPSMQNALVMRRREIARGMVEWSLGMQQPLWDRLHEITIPVLWVVGQRDAKFLDLATRAVAALPNAILAVAPESGHRVPWDAEPWLATTVAEFLKRTHHQNC